MYFLIMKGLLDSELHILLSTISQMNQEEPESEHSQKAALDYKPAYSSLLSGSLSSATATKSPFSLMGGTLASKLTTSTLTEEKLTEEKLGECKQDVEDTSTKDQLILEPDDNISTILLEIMEDRETASRTSWIPRATFSHLFSELQSLLSLNMACLKEYCFQLTKLLCH